jgi:hypothetical protein
MHQKDHLQAAGPTREFRGVAFSDKSGKSRHRRDVARPIVAVVEDGGIVSQEFGMVCEFLDIAVHPVSTYADLGTMLPALHPMASVCGADGAGQDGCNIMKAVADYDPELPLMIVTGADAAVAGAIDAVEEIWHLREVIALPVMPNAAGLVDFLFRAGRKANCARFKGE